MLNTISVYGKTTMDIQTNELNLSGIVYFLENKPRENLEVVLNDNSAYEINLKDICNLNLSFYNYEF